MNYWFVATIVNVIEVLDGKQEQYPIREDFVLYKIQSLEELDNKIQATMDSMDAARSGGIEYCGRPARMYCLGVRKIKSIFNLDVDEDPPTNDSTLSYNFMTVKTLEEAKLVGQGKAVHVYYLDDDDEDDDEDDV